MEDLTDIVAEKLCARYGDGRPWSLITKAKRHDWRVTAQWIIAGIDASGTHAVVPVDPTEDMLETGDHAERGDPLDCYRKMLAARPKLTGETG